MTEIEVLTTLPDIRQSNAEQLMKALAEKGFTTELTLSGNYYKTRIVTVGKGEVTVDINTDEITVTPISTWNHKAQKYKTKETFPPKALERVIEYANDQNLKDKAEKDFQAKLNSQKAADLKAKLEADYPELAATGYDINAYSSKTGGIELRQGYSSRNELNEEQARRSITTLIEMHKASPNTAISGEVSYERPLIVAEGQVKTINVSKQGSKEVIEVKATLENGKLTLSFGNAKFTF